MTRLTATQMTEAQGEALCYLASLPAPVSPARIGEDLAPVARREKFETSTASGYAIIRDLAAFGLIARCGRASWEITERGRIAAALFMARHLDLAKIYFEDEWMELSLA